jgi:ankyrin repeat protein
MHLCVYIGDVMQDGYMPLHRAAVGGHSEVVSLLLEGGAGVDIEAVTGVRGR